MLRYNYTCITNGDRIRRSEQYIYTVQEVTNLIDESDIEADPETEIDESDAEVEEEPRFFSFKKLLRG